MNFVHLEGTLQGNCWTRWKSRERGQVRFWLGVSRHLAGDGLDLLLCAIEPKSAEEVWRLQTELREGRSCSLQASVHSLVDADRPLAHQETAPGVIFVAETCGMDGRAEHSAHRVGIHRRHAHGKLAAAGDDAELPLEGTQ